ncbi:CHAD domain-containing protein [Salibacterium sp. K-3]
MAGKTQTRQVDAMGRVVVPKDIREELALTEHPLTLDHETNRLAVIVSKTNENEENCKILDDQGRLLIPAALRQEFDWKQGDKIEVEVENDIIRLQAAGASCSICGSRDSIVKVKGLFLCRDCMENAGAAWTERWQTVLEEIVQEYVEFCEKAVSFTDIEDLHQARVKGRRLQTLLSFLGIPEDHKLMDRLDDAHKRLGRVRERDVLIDAFLKRAEQEAIDEEAAVFRDAAAVVHRKREKEQEKLAKNLPKIINQKFQEHWETFCSRELPALVRSMTLEERLQTHERAFQEKKEQYQTAAAEKGAASKAALKALHDVRIESKKLRYIYAYVSGIYSSVYASEAKAYKQYQRQFGDINDIRDWLKMLKDTEKKLEVSTEHINAVKEKLQEELETKAAAVHIE